MRLHTTELLLHEGLVLDSRRDPDPQALDGLLRQLRTTTDDSMVRHEISLLLTRSAQLDQERRELDHYRLDLADRETQLECAQQATAAQVERLQQQRHDFADRVALVSGCGVGLTVGALAWFATREAWAGVIAALFAITIIAILPAWHRLQAERDDLEGYDDVVLGGDDDRGLDGDLLAGLEAPAGGGLAGGYGPGARA